MIYQYAADALVLIHLLFILFVIFGGILVFKWHWLAWLHIPAALWGSVVVTAGWICPLTPFENQLRQSAGNEGYSGTFIEHYVIPVIYPSGLNREIFIAMGIGMFLVNLAIYFILIRRKKKSS